MGSVRCFILLIRRLVWLGLFCVFLALQSTDIGRKNNILVNLKQLFKKKQKKPKTVKELKISKYLCLTLFIIGAAVITHASVTSVAAFFLIPSIDVAITLPANIWIAAVFGGIGTQFFVGFFMYYFWVEYKQASKELKALQEGKVFG